MDQTPANQVEDEEELFLAQQEQQIVKKQQQAGIFSDRDYGEENKTLNRVK